MPNDDLGQFPTPTSSPEPTISEDTSSATSDTTPPDNQQTVPEISTVIEDINTPPTDQISEEPFSTPPITAPTTSDSMSEPPSAFEETPEEIPSIASVPEQPSNTPIVEQEPIVPLTSELETNPAISQPKPLPPTPPDMPTEFPAATVPKGGSSFGPFLIIILLLLAGVGLAGSVILYSQSAQLRQQLSEITQTLERQRTVVTPMPTPSIEEAPTPSPTDLITPTPTATIGATITPTLTITPTATPTISALPIMPLAEAAKALTVAINHEPNAQMILIKTESATDPQTASTKYFFRQNLTNKKYFYVLISGANEPEIVDKAIYVTPDNNIPTLNDHVLANTLGIDMNEAISLAQAQCQSGLCTAATVKAQYIKSGTNLIWQLSFTPLDPGKSTIVAQLNATTKEVLYKSPGF